MSVGSNGRLANVLSGMKIAFSRRDKFVRQKRLLPALQSTQHKLQLKSEDFDDNSYVITIVS